MSEATSDVRVLLVAYACEPGRGSEPGAGWAWALELARHGRVTVLTRANNRDAVESWAGWDSWTGDRPEFIYHDLPSWIVRMKRLRVLGVHAYHYLWQRSAATTAIRHIERHPARWIAHHVTFGAYWYPSAAAGLGVPYILGPMGGAESTPKPLRRYFTLAGRFTEWFRDTSRRLFEADPAVRRSLRGAAVAFATTPASADRMRALGCRDVRIMAHVGHRAEAEVDVSGGPSRSEQPDAVTFLSVSRLIEWKGVAIAVRAMSRLGDVPFRYTILGEGPQQASLTRLIRRLGLEDRVRILGRLAEYDDVLRLYSDSDVFVHLATHESGGMAVAEAMASHLPCVVFDYGGPGLLVTGDTGAAIRPDESALERVAEALLRYANEPRRRRDDGERASRRIRECFSWSGRGEQMWTLYRELSE